MHNSNKTVLINKNEILCVCVCVCMCGSCMITQKNVCLILLKYSIRVACIPGIGHKRTQVSCAWQKHKMDIGNC